MLVGLYDLGPAPDQRTSHATHMKNKSSIDSFELAFKAVHIKCLNKDGSPVSVASGFVRRENDAFYLYTCWHVLTGYDMRDLKVMQPPNRMALAVYYQGFEKRAPHVEVTGGQQVLHVELYDHSTNPPTPRWLQDAQHVPHPDLNAIGIRVPFWHDLAKMKLPPDLNISGIQVIEEEATAEWAATPGEKVVLVGFPYGYSTMSMAQPTPVVLSRFVAARCVAGFVNDVLLDGMGAPGMSGCPIFAQAGNNTVLAGIYTGCLFPDHVISQNNPVTALGKASNLTFALRKHSGLPIVAHDDARVSEAVRAG